MNVEKYRRLFVEEASDHLAEMSGALARLESRDGGDPEAAIDTLFRMAHSIKGMASSLDYEALATLAHRLEDWLEPLREASVVPDAALPLLYQVVAALEEMVCAVEETGEAPAPREDLLRELSRPPDTREPRRASARPQAPAELKAPPLPRSVRVRAETIDRFIAAVGELMQRQARIEELHRLAPMWERKGEVSEELDGMERVVRELRRRALDVRTTPVRRVLDRLPRVASELARSLGKRVEVTLSGEEVEVDRAVLDHLDDSLLHLVRNAVDHGIESPPKRSLAGKDPIGKIQVSAARVGGRLRLRLADDGEGIDLEHVRRRAVDCGLLPEAVAEDLPLERAAELLFEPGMSTKQEVSQISGRGVGLDAVKSRVEALGGVISLTCSPGEGTAFDLDLPSMVALQRVLVLEVAGERVALPVSRVDSVLNAAEGLIEGVGGDSFFVWKDEPMPLLDLGPRILAGESCAPARDGRGSVVVLETQGFRFGLRVDRALGDHEVFVREVPPVLSSLRALAGVAVLTDGAPVFLLEAGVLVEDFI